MKDLQTGETCLLFTAKGRTQGTEKKRYFRAASTNRWNHPRNCRRRFQFDEPHRHLPGVVNCPKMNERESACMNFCEAPDKE
jgi:hypothetical protein